MPDPQLKAIPVPHLSSPNSSPYSFHSFPALPVYSYYLVSASLPLPLPHYFILVFPSSQDAITSLSVSLTRLYLNEPPLDTLNTQVHKVGYHIS